MPRLRGHYRDEGHEHVDGLDSAVLVGVGVLIRRLQKVHQVVRLRLSDHGRGLAAGGDHVLERLDEVDEGVEVYLMSLVAQHVHHVVEDAVALGVRDRASVVAALLQNGNLDAVEELGELEQALVVGRQALDEGKIDAQVVASHRAGRGLVSMVIEVATAGLENRHAVLHVLDTVEAFEGRRPEANMRRVLRHEQDGELGGAAPGSELDELLQKRPDDEHAVARGGSPDEADVDGLVKAFGDDVLHAVDRLLRREDGGQQYLQLGRDVALPAEGELRQVRRLAGVVAALVDVPERPGNVLDVVGVQKSAVLKVDEEDEGDGLNPRRLDGGHEQAQRLHHAADQRNGVRVVKDAFQHVRLAGLHGADLLSEGVAEPRRRHAERRGRPGQDYVDLVPEVVLLGGQRVGVARGVVVGVEHAQQEKDVEVAALAEQGEAVVLLGGEVLGDELAQERLLVAVVFRVP
ncbi:exonuclease subunit SbcC [Babesia caballi]|uniref:Exonuclease subunit SbcC n=1 Tax=Babesia caballi TaxID=5871 RepID=A0AAV4LLN6_BABCB|nr:exonuclease subunit SbcC [Babesia caballi]